MPTSKTVLIRQWFKRSPLTNESTKTANDTPPLILVDGSSYLYRAFHALPDLATSDGRPTGAVRGVIAMLKKMLKDYQPTHVAVIFDAKGKTFRDELFPEYKATRPPMPNELRDQIEPLHRLVEALGLPMIVEPGVEADDVIGTLADAASQQQRDVLISTGDKDMAQLVNPYVTLINTMTNVVMGRDGVIEKFAVKPEQIVDYLTLIGDKVDNVPGIDKVGPKTAAKWLEAHGNLDEIMTHAESIKGKVGENLREALERLPLSRELVTIKLDVPLKESLDDLEIRPINKDLLINMYADLEFKSWLEELQDDGSEGSVAAAEPAPEANNYVAITTQPDLDNWIERLKSADLFAFDTETTSLDYMDAELVGMSFCVTPGEAAYLPLAHDYMDAPEQLNMDAVLEQLKPILENPDIAKLGHNLKYDRSVLVRHGIQLLGIRHDTMLESYVLDSTAVRHNLDALCEKYLSHSNIHFEDVAGKGAKQITFNQVPLELATPYAAEDADMALRLHQKFWPKLEALDRLRQLYETIELPLIAVLSRIERNGVYVDAAELGRQAKEVNSRLVEIQQQAYVEAGTEFNLGSPKQLQEILFDQLNLPVIRKTPKGQPSTAEDVLQELAGEYKLPAVILEHRSLSKLKSTYLDKLPQQINLTSGRVHTSYHQAVASTGRLSSSTPNLQNIPIRTAIGRRIRQAFSTPPGRKIVAIDYSQIELRIMAHLSGDESLVSAFAAGLDIHSATAAEVFGGTADAVSGDDRRAAKAINFGLIYGMSAFGLAKQLKITNKEAQAYVELYFSRYPGVKQYMDDTRELARNQGFVETVYGRRLYLPEIKARNAQRRNYAERTAINAPMQGTAADIIKLAMLDVHDWLPTGSPSALMIMQVHDELVFEVDQSAASQLADDVAARMEKVAGLDVPLVAESGVGDNWDEAH